MSLISLDAFDAKSKSALSLSAFNESFDANPSGFFYPLKKCPACKGTRCKCNCCIVEGFDSDANTAGITEPESPMQKPDVKKPSHPTQKQYLDAVASIKKSEAGTRTPFTSFEEVAQCFKNLGIIKACHRAENDFLKKENEMARIRIEKEREAEKQAEIEEAEKEEYNKKLKAWAKSTQKLLKSMR